jgi:CRISPR-associated protein Csm4
MSDTLFGHFCWAIRYRESEEYLSDFLNSYGLGKPAPVLFSSAFLSGCLPRPTLPPPSRDQIRKFVHLQFGDAKKDVFDGLSKVKDWNKIRQITIRQWLGLKGDYSDIELYKNFSEKTDEGSEKTVQVEIATSNTINRLSGTVPPEGGGLFQREKTWYMDGINLNIYVEVSCEDIFPTVDWFLTAFLPENGYGADKSIGMGSLMIERDKSFDSSIFLTQGANAQMSLSFSSFIGMEEIDAFYRLKTKFGKLGGSFAFSSPTGGNPRPFKKPILMYEPGAVFFCNDSLNDKPLLKNIHSDDRIRHCGIPITLPFKIREDLYHDRAA